MSAEQYPTLHLTGLHGVFTDIADIPRTDGTTGTGRFRIAVIGHATQGHVALIAEDEQHKFVARLLSRDEAVKFTEPLLAAHSDGPTG